ncbi:MAG: DPP IV N-terminal domain-containing protein [Prevotella sp.]|nr:DPP IV N-terminal domain-containing protein [Prevotella sp.]
MMMKKTKTVAVLAAVLALLSLPMNAQQKLFTLEDLNFGGTNFRNMQPQNMWLTWWGDQLVRTDVEECYLVDSKTGKEKLLFTLADVQRWVEGSEGVVVRRLSDATFPYPGQPVVSLKDGRTHILLDFKAKQVIWKNNVAARQVNDWNSVSRATAYVQNQQLWVADGEGREHQLTKDGSREIVYGQSVHRNEFGIDRGTFWSPDGQRLAFYRMDQSMVSDYPQVDLFPRVAAYEPDKYPMAGMTSHKVTVGVYDLRTDKTVYLQAGDPTDRYFTNVSWSPDSKTVYMLELNREQNDCRLVSYNAETGQRLAELDRETSPKYVEPQHPIQFLPWNSDQFILQSQRDGYNHLYLFNSKGQLLKQLTQGPWVVMDVLGFNQKTKSVIIKSNERGHLQSNVFSVSIANGRRVCLDTGNANGVVQQAQLSASGEKVYVKFSEPTVPRRILLTATQAPKNVMLLNAPDPWAGYQQPQFDHGTLTAADGVTPLHYRLVRPADFDPQKKYPTVVYVYGGPHAHNVDASWHWASRSWETYMAQKGYVLFILDNRGSENRGREFEQATWHQLGQEEMKDQMEGVKFLRSLPYVDAERIGVHGWSFGGFMTISLITNYPDVFKVGVAGGPVIDWKWYEVMYGERYMGTPESNPEGYQKCSLLPQAKNLKGRLQIITGYNDDTVVPQHCLSFLDACVKAGTQPDFFAYPGEGHNMRGHASVHLHERITQYFEDFLK